MYFKIEAHSGSLLRLSSCLLPLFAWSKQLFQETAMRTAIEVFAIAWSNQMALLPFLSIFEKERPSPSSLTHPLDFLTMHAAANISNNSSIYINPSTNSTGVCHPSSSLSAGGGLVAPRHDGSMKPDFAPLEVSDNSWGDRSLLADRARDQVLKVYYLLASMFSRRGLNPTHSGPQGPSIPAPLDTNTKMPQNPTRRHARLPVSDLAELRLLSQLSPQEPSPTHYRRDLQTTTMGFPSFLSSITRFSSGVPPKSPSSPPVLQPPPPLSASLLFPPCLKEIHPVKEDPTAREDIYAGKHWRPDVVSSKQLQLFESSMEPRTRKRHLKRCHNTPSSLSTTSGGGITQDRRKQIFRRGGRVHLADGTVQRVECLQLEDFIQSWRTRATAECRDTADISLCWALIQGIEAGATARDVRILFRVQEFLRTSAHGLGPREGLTDGQHLTLTFEHQCGADNPFFVRTFGWSAWEPQLAHLHCGIICRQLALGDTCLVLLTAPHNHLRPTQMSVPPTESLIHRVTTKGPGLPSSHETAVEGRRASELSSGGKIKRKEKTIKDESTELPSAPPKTKRPPGSVPSYFSAASLAKSPFDFE
ncbi:social behavior [Sparganum proliferum]